MATLEEVDLKIKEIAASITEAKASGTAKTDPANLKKLVVSNLTADTPQAAKPRAAAATLSAVCSYCTLGPSAGLAVLSAGPVGLQIDLFGARYCRRLRPFVFLSQAHSILYTTNVVRYVPVMHLSSRQQSGHVRLRYRGPIAPAVRLYIGTAGTATAEQHMCYCGCWSHIKPWPY